MNEARGFFKAYPEAEDILPIYSPQTVMQWIGEEESLYPPINPLDSFPSVQKEHSIWFRKNLTSSQAESTKHQQEVSGRYIQMFRERVSKLLRFMGPKTTEERIMDILDIRNDFFAYPVEIEKAFLQTFQSKKINNFGNIDEESLKNNDSFRDYYREAISYSQETVPQFNQKKHLSPHFSGFVRQISIPYDDVPYWYSTPKFEAQGAYIKNGEIIWSIHDGHGPSHFSVPSHWKDSLVKWYSGDFVLEEVYLDEWNGPSDKPGPKPSSQEKKATFQFENTPIQEVQVMQRLHRESKKEEFVINIIKSDNTHTTFTANQSTHPSLIFQLKSHPSFLSKIDNVIPLLQDESK